MLFLDGVHTERADGAVAFSWVRAPTSGELTDLAQRIGRLLERQGLLEQDAENADLSRSRFGPWLLKHPVYRLQFRREAGKWEPLNTTGSIS